jgi:hypothetical protein
MRHLRPFFPRPWSHVDSRGQILIVYGVIWVLIGSQVLIEPDPAGWENLPIVSSVPREIRALAWILTGSLAILFAWRPRWIAHDGLGFLALYVMPTERVFILVWGWIDSVCPPIEVLGWFTLFDGPGDPAGLRSAAIYLAIVAAVIVNSRIPAQRMSDVRRDGMPT